MMTLRDILKQEYAAMPTENLEGILREGIDEVVAWMRDIAHKEGIEPAIIARGEQIRREEAAEMIADIRAELARRKTG